ncbi:amino acid permease [Clostridium sp. DL-VIII]|uniref:amino acid permease n=1 Tax=Clostridium sp. DL-VIII TaxID=641107 RepID=UPI001FA7C26F|nr:amino acid permease [Clostridium sp. DL-VIII]
MTSISINRPVKGSFRVYAEQYMGKFTGFLLGWVIFISGILTLGSEAIAAGIFLKYWIPNISSSIFSLAALIIVIFINRLGTKYFGYIESVMSIAKIAIIIFFVALGIFFISGNGILPSKNPSALILGMLIVFIT